MLYPEDTALLDLTLLEIRTQDLFTTTIITTTTATVKMLPIDIDNNINEGRRG